MRGLSGEKKTHALWTAFKKTDAGKQLSNSIEQLNYKASDGKTYAVDFVDDKGLYLVAQYMRVKHDRPALNAIRDFLAKAGVFADYARRNPVEAAAQLTARAKGIQKRNEFTAAAHDTHIAQQPNYAALTNTEYKTLFGAYKGELVKQLGLTPQQANHFRDQLHVHALNTLQSVEDASAARMRQLNRTLTDAEQNAIVVDYAREALPFLRRVCADLGIHLAVDRPLLSR